MTTADLERIRAACQSSEPVLIPLREMGGYLAPEELAELIASGLKLYGAELEGEPDPVRAVEVHEFVAACEAHVLADGLLDALLAGDDAPAAS